MPMISAVQPSIQNNNWGDQQWPNLTSSDPDQWSLTQKVCAFFFFVIGVLVLSRIFKVSHTGTTNSLRSSNVKNIVVTNGRIVNGAVSFPRKRDAGQMKKGDSRKIGYFETIELNVPGHFTIVRGKKNHPEISLSADRDIFDKLEDIVLDRKLIIQAQPQTAFVINQPIEYTIVIPERILLKEIKVTTAAQVAISHLESEEFRCIIEDAGKVVVQAGKAVKQEIIMNGTGSYDARSILTTHTIVVIKGAGTAHVKASQTLDVNIEGSGRCICYGIPVKIIKKVPPGALVFKIMTEAV